MDELEIDGIRIAYRRAGESNAGPPLVLLHGAVSDSRDWGPQIDALDDEFALIAWDAPGAGAFRGAARSRSRSTSAVAARRLADPLRRLRRLKGLAAR